MIRKKRAIIGKTINYQHIKERDLLSSDNNDPYWNSLSKRKVEEGQFEYIEPPTANPDILIDPQTEEEFMQRAEMAREQLDLIKQAFSKTLKKTEADFLNSVLAGKNNKQIAREYKVSEAYVSVILSGARRKLEKYLKNHLT